MFHLLSSRCDGDGPHCFLRKGVPARVIRSKIVVVVIPSEMSLTCQESYLSSIPGYEVAVLPIVLVVEMCGWAINSTRHRLGALLSPSLLP